MDSALRDEADREGSPGVAADSTEGVFTEPAADAAPAPDDSIPTRPGGAGMAANFASLATSQLITWALALAWTFVVPRMLGPESLGILVLATSLTSLVAVALSFLSREYVVREMVRNVHGARSLLLAALVTRAAVVPLIFLACFVYGRVADLTGVAMTVLYLIAGAASATMLTDPALATFQATERMRYIAYADVFNKSLNTLGAIVLVLTGLGVVAVASFTFAVAAFVLCLALWWAHRVLGGLRGRPAPLRPALRGARSYWFVSVFYVGYLWADGFLLGVLAPAEVVGWYGAATRLFTTMMFVATLIGTVSLPRLVVAHERGDDALLWEARRPFEWAVILGLPIGVGMACLAEGIIGLLYGTAFLPAAPALELLGLSIPFMYANIIVGQVFIAAGRPRRIVTMLSVAAVINLVLNLLLIPLTQERYGNGAIGAGIALLATEVVQFGIGTALLGRRLMARTTVGRLARTGLATAGMAVVLVLLGGASLLLALVAGVASFVVLMLLLRVPTPHERAMVARLGSAILGRFPTRQDSRRSP